MLRELRIRDIAIVDDLALTFGAGLNVLTGETGAGKSIIVQSLAVLCGARASSELIRADADEAIVEGLFECQLTDAQRDALGLGAGDEEILVRRHLSRSGKSRIHINGSPVTLAMLAQLGDSLVHVYGQHEQAQLLRPASHLDLLDQFANLEQRGADMAVAAAAASEARRQLASIEQTRAQRAERRELLEHQQAELTDAAVQADEEANLRQERELLRNAERVRQVCREGEAALYAGHGAMAATLARLGTQVKELGGIAPALKAAAELIDGGRVQLEEAAFQLRAVAGRVQDDPERLNAIEERLMLLARLGRKYGVSSDQLPAVCARIGAELEQLDADAGDAAAAQARADQLRGDALALARSLSAARREAARRLEARMADELRVLGMPGAMLRVEQEAPEDDATASVGARGIDRIEFHLAANPGETPKPLARVASGGELSRIMLALKALTGSVAETPILIFDEVDAGIGGTIADAVAKRLKTLARNRQLLCITHLAQIAAYADHHFAVEKRAHGGRTITRARALQDDERVAEVSRMLGGAAAPAEADRYARRLIAEARRAERAPTHP